MWAKKNMFFFYYGTFEVILYSSKGSKVNFRQKDRVSLTRIWDALIFRMGDLIFRMGGPHI